MKSKKILIIMSILTLTFANVHLASARNRLENETSENDKSYIEAHIDAVVDGDIDFFNAEQKQISAEPMQISAEPYNELELKLLENEERAEFIENYYNETSKQISNNQLRTQMEPEVISYDMDKAIKADLVGLDFFSYSDIYEIFDGLERNQYYAWYVPAINDEGEDVTLSFSNVADGSTLNPDAIYRTASGDDYINTAVIYDNIDEDKITGITYIRYFNCILAIVTTDTDEFLVPIVNGGTVGLFEEEAYPLIDAFDSINNYFN